MRKLGLGLGSTWAGVLTLGMVISSGAIAWAVDDDPAVRRDLLRTVLSGDDAGALDRPLQIADAPTAARVCRELQSAGRKAFEGDAFERGKARKAQQEDRKRALARVYSVTLPASAFEVEDYRFKKRQLPLKLSHAISALEGALVLQVMRPAGGAFKLEAEEARGIAGRIAAEQAGLRMTFRVAEDEHPPCFAYPRASAFNLRIVPLAYELLDDRTGAVLARARTPALERLRRFLDPGEARLTVKLAPATPVSPVLATADSAVQSGRPALEVCAKDVMASRADTFLASFVANVGSGGSVAEVHIDAQDASHEGVAECMRQALAKLNFPKGAITGPVHLFVAVERGDLESGEVL